MARYKSPFEKFYRYLGRLSLLVLSLPFALILCVGIKGSYDEAKALQRARELPAVERQAIVEACIRIAGTIQEDRETELIFGDRPGGSGRAIPTEFLPLQPRRVNVRKDKASIKLQFMMDSGVFIYIEHLNTPSPIATLSWGETDEREIWSAPSLRASSSPSPVKSDQ